MMNCDNLKNDIENLIKESSASISVTFCDLDNDEKFSINGNKKVPSASMIKLLIMLTILNKVESKEISLDEKIKLVEDERVGGSGVLKELSCDHSFTIKELLTLMIIISDNYATNILIDKIGMDNINKLGKELNLFETSLERIMMDTDAQSRGLDNFTSSEDVFSMLKIIYEKSFLRKDLSDLALDILLRQQERDRLQRYLPEDLKLANKSGDLDFLENDGGIFFTNSKNYILVILVNNAVSNVIAKDIIGKISLKIYDSIIE